MRRPSAQPICHDGAAVRDGETGEMRVSPNQHKCAQPETGPPAWDGIDEIVVLLVAATAIGHWISDLPLGSFLGLNPTLQIIAVCALVFTPVAFAGVVFATTFKRTSQPDRVFGMNVAGALCGGLAENASILLGFQLLLCVAVGFYLCSAIAGNQKLPTSEAEKSV